MKISVILTSYNRDVLLRAAIESVLSQSHPDFELFIMDDDSENPKTHEVLSDFDNSALRSKVHIYRHKLNGVDRYSRTGYAENINRALGWVTGQAICYLTCDDIFLPDCLSRCSEHFEKHPDHMVAYGVQSLVRLHPDFSTTFEGLRNPGPEVSVGACVLDHNQMMHRIECVKECGLPLWPTDPQYIGMADAVVWQKFTAKGWIAHRLEDQRPTCEHRFHKGSIQAL
jgi:spore maturation protein CgeD